MFFIYIKMFESVRVTLEYFIIYRDQGASHYWTLCQCLYLLAFCWCGFLLPLICFNFGLSIVSRLSAVLPSCCFGSNCSTGEDSCFCFRSMHFVEAVSSYCWFCSKMCAGVVLTFFFRRELLYWCRFILLF